MKRFSIGNRAIGAGEPVFVIAEMSANHGRSFDHAAAIVRAAQEAGADAVKLQTYTADTMTLDLDTEHFRIRGTAWNGQRLYSLYAEASMPWEWQPRLKRLAEDLGLLCFSTPFDPSAVDFLETVGMPAHKVASFEIVDIPLLERIGRTGKPVILSTGMASREEIQEALEALERGGSRDVALLHCVSAYPSAPEDMRLRTIPDLRDAFDRPVGLSDHSMSERTVVAAVALGACIVEKHFCLARSDGGPDSAFSLEPGEFRSMVEAIRQTEQAVQAGTGRPRREDASRAFRRSLFVTEDMRAGEPFTEKTCAASGHPSGSTPGTRGRSSRPGPPRTSPGEPRCPGS